MTKCEKCGFVGPEMTSPFVAHEVDGLRCLRNQLAAKEAELATSQQHVRELEKGTPLSTSNAAGGHGSDGAGAGY